jgi:hypothetical protein
MARYSRNWPPLFQVIVVLGIIAVMVAILFPLFQKVHEGNRRGCGSNLKQIGLGLDQYAQDSDEVMPSGVTPTGNGWAGTLYPFIKSTEAYRCPNDPSQAPFISYAENQNIVRQKFDNFTSPASTVVFYETTTLNCDPSTAETVSTTGLSAPQDSTRHDAEFGLYFATLDGHVKFITPNKVSGGPHAVSAKSMPQRAYVETFAVK